MLDHNYICAARLLVSLKIGLGASKTTATAAYKRGSTLLSTVAFGGESLDKKTTELG